MTSPTEAGFRDLGLHPEVLAAIEEDLKFETPSPIQREAIPVVANGTDLIAKAETGTGKTLAFCAPIIGRLDPTRTAVQAIVLCPTRELAQQVAEVAEALGKRIGIESVLLVGGVHQSEQILKLRSGAQMVVGTPGRVLDFLGQGTLRLGWTQAAVLDEADRMLDMGFIDDVTKILSSMPEDRQMLLFSATIPPRLKSLSKRFMRNPETVSTVQGMATVPEIRQCYVEMHGGDKEGFVLDMIDRYPDDTCIVFCNTRKEVIELDRCLWGLGYDAGSLHGDHEQDQRFRVLEAFKSRSIKTLVATDVAARGLDITEVARVINYDVPDEVETYVHRIGRTGRAGGVGESITLVTRKDRVEWDRIERTTGFEIEQLTDWEPTRPRRKVESEDKRRRATDERRKMHVTRATERLEKENARKQERSGGRGRSRRSGSDDGSEPQRSSGGRSGGRRSDSGRSGSDRGGSEEEKRSSRSNRSRRGGESRDRGRDGGSQRDERERGGSSRRRTRHGGRGDDSKSEAPEDVLYGNTTDSAWDHSDWDFDDTNDKGKEQSDREGKSGEGKGRGRGRGRGRGGRGRGGRNRQRGDKPRDDKSRGDKSREDKPRDDRPRGQDKDRDESAREDAPRRKRPRRRRRKPSGGGGQGDAQRGGQSGGGGRSGRGSGRDSSGQGGQRRGGSDRDERASRDRDQDRPGARKERDGGSRDEPTSGVNPYAAGLSGDRRSDGGEDRPSRRRRRR